MLPYEKYILYTNCMTLLAVARLVAFCRPSYLRRLPLEAAITSALGVTLKLAAKEGVASGYDDELRRYDHNNNNRLLSYANDTQDVQEPPVMDREFEPPASSSPRRSEALRLVLGESSDLRPSTSSDAEFRAERSQAGPLRRRHESREALRSGREQYRVGHRTLLTRANRMARCPDFGILCHGCGDPGHSRYCENTGELKCPFFKSISPKNYRYHCPYINCSDSRPHDYSFCRSLHSICPLCNHRGHDSVDVCRRRSTKEHKKIFDSSRRYGYLTSLYGYEFEV